MKLATKILASLLLLVTGAAAFAQSYPSRATFLSAGFGCNPNLFAQNYIVAIEGGSATQQGFLCIGGYPQTGNNGAIYLFNSGFNPATDFPNKIYTTGLDGSGYPTFNVDGGGYSQIFRASDGFVFAGTADAHTSVNGDVIYLNFGPNDPRFTFTNDTCGDACSFAFSSNIAGATGHLLFGVYDPNANDIPANFLDASFNSTTGAFTSLDFTSAAFNATGTTSVNVSGGASGAIFGSSGTTTVRSTNALGSSIALGNGSMVFTGTLSGGGSGLNLTGGTVSVIGSNNFVVGSATWNGATSSVSGAGSWSGTSGTFSGNLSVTGTSNLVGAISSSGGNVTVADNLDVTSAGDLSIGGGTMTVDGATGNTTVNDLTINGTCTGCAGGVGSVYACTVDSSAAAETCSPGWSAAHTSTGTYTVTHNLGLSAATDLACTPSILYNGTNHRITMLISEGVNSFVVGTYDDDNGGGGTIQDNAFRVICAQIQ